ncbi:MAG: hypothetical protein NTV93_08915 [Verrucomicrobia bacterium]|nr:hypothetical protein [Verrucomicrobiota bacterium]
MKTTPPNKPFQQLVFTGILGWITGSVALLAAAWFLTKHESFFEPMMWAASHWWAAFAFGFLAMLARGARVKESLGSALLAYLLPVGIIAGVAGLCLAIYPEAGFRDEMAGYLPVVLVFYVFGLVWLRASEGTAHSFARAVLPPILGGLMILGFVAVPVFASNAFRYRDAFGLEVVSTAKPEGFVVTDAVLEIRKPGNYKFTAPQFAIYSISMEFAPEKADGEITWGAAGEPKEGATGKFPLQVRWKNPAAQAGRPPMREFENTIVLEARDASAPQIVVSVVSAPIESPGPKH